MKILPPPTSQAPLAHLPARYRDAQGNDDLTLAWLGGYFGVREDDVVNASPTNLGQRKNIDFLRLRDIPLHAVDARPGKKILEIGCCNGATMVYMGLQGANVFGQDMNQREVDNANAMLTRFGLQGHAVAGDARQLHFGDNTFDSVISSDFFEHVTDETKIAVLNEAVRVVKPGGIIVTKTPNLKYLQLSLLYKRLRAVMKFQNPMRYLIPHTPGTPYPEHIGLATRWSFTKCLEAAGILNYSFQYAPLRRFGSSPWMEVLSTEIPVVRDYLCEDLFCIARKPIALSHFPE